MPDTEHTEEMRILHLTSHLNVGGITTSVLSLARGLTARGHRLFVASGGGEREEALAASGAAHWVVPLHTSVEFSPQVLKATEALSRRVTQEPVDLLHAHTRVGQLVADRLSRRHRIPYVTTWHGFYRRNLGRRLWPCTGRVTIAISDPVRQHLLDDFHVPSARIQLIPHGIDPSPFTGSLDAATQQLLRQRLGLRDGKAVIGTVARLIPSRHIEQLIHSFAQVRAARPDTQLLIVGDGPARGALARVVEEQGLRDAVCFAGTLPETRVALSLMSVFVFLPADEEGFGLSLLEAMASACPIVAVRRGRGSTWVLERDASSAWLVESNDLAGLTDRLLSALRDPVAAHAQGEQLRALVQAQYTLDRVVRDVEAVYRRVIEDAGAARQPAGVT